MAQGGWIGGNEMSDHIPDDSKMDTPETDELINANLDKLGLLRLAMFCQRLERERNEAQECLRQAMSPRGSVSVKTRMRWLKAAGLTNIGNNENLPIVNREEEQ
jgi:hypothetical protein